MPCLKIMVLQYSSAEIVKAADSLNCFWAIHAVQSRGVLMAASATLDRRAKARLRLPVSGAWTGDGGRECL